jgi:N-methylhydantoinase A
LPLFGEMERQARELLTAAGAETVQITLTRSADMRYAGQGYEVDVALPAAELSAAGDAAIRAAFSHRYQLTFGRTLDEPASEIVSWRSSATGPESAISLAYDCGNGELDTPVYDRYALAPGTSIRGPAVLHERHSSCAFGPDCVITVDDSFNLVAELG